MPRIPEVSQSAGLRRLAIGGVSVTAAHQQITQNLDKALGPGGGLFLAEPAERGDKIDWYTAAEGPARRLAELDEPERSGAGERLRQTLESVSAYAERLKGEKDEYQSHLGHLIELAIQIPDERHVWMIGDQPVLTFWGTTREVGQPVESPVYRLVPPKPPEAETIAATTERKDAAAQSAVEAAGQEGASGPGGAGGDGATGDAVAAGTGEAAAAVRAVETERVSRLALILLWLLLALLLFAIGFQLLRSCALYVPWLSDQPLVNFCSRPGGEAELARLFNERERLESERRLLLEQIERERRACLVSEAPTPPTPDPTPPGPTPPAPEPTPPAPEPTPPAPGPTPPPSPGPTPQPTPSKFSGCWGTRDVPIGITTTDANGNKRSIASDFFLCVEQTGGRGRFAVRGQDQWSCNAETTIEETSDHFTARYTSAACGDGSAMGKADVTCKPAEESTLTCSQIEYLPDGQAEDPTNQIHDIKFYRVEAIPQ
jgi:hypothetical protein